MKFSNSYYALGKGFFEEIEPAQVKAPQLFLWNNEIAQQLLVHESIKDNADDIAQVFSGNRILPGAKPIAMAYSGHQFGHFSPQLGDGRAHLIGELVDRDNKHWDIQLKGSGRTSFSRGGDGLCALGPAVREFIMSQAMAALGVPTTRCLSVVTTGESVYRETVLPGAVVTRVAASHIRVGTFQFFAARGDQDSLRSLCDYTIKRHFPEIAHIIDENDAQTPSQVTEQVTEHDTEQEQGSKPVSAEQNANKYYLLLDKAIEKQIDLVVSWMRVGFIHGVMNTDNTAISGETIDYGPCAMMGTYDPQTVFSSIDRNARYAFANQPNIAHWNMTRFAECLLPLVDKDEEVSLKILQPLIVNFAERFETSYINMMGAKLGFNQVASEEQQLITTLLDLMKQKKMDYTITFNNLSDALEQDGSELNAEVQLKNELGEWFDDWKKLLDKHSLSLKQVIALMRENNPVVIPRNHHVEAVLKSCLDTGSADAAKAFLQVLASPYKATVNTAQYQDPANEDENCYQTFCGT
jgi:serine/tyrosine/threonine adenylyltransferase